MKTRKSNGFTLVELMVTMLVAAIVLGVGIPAFSQFVSTNQMAAAVNDFTTAIHMARTEAVKRRANVTMCPSADWDSAAPTCNNGGTFQNGWIVFVDCTVQPPPANTCGAPNYNVDAFDTVVSVHGPLPDDIVANFTTNPGTPQYVTYSATGFPRQIAVGLPPKTDFQLCDHRGNTDIGGGVAAGRWVRIAPTGRPQIYRDVADVQSGLNPLGGC
ncbi:MAG: GspH/FimT family pseudopilin [Gammaproteobacteria bacterium]